MYYTLFLLAAFGLSVIFSILVKKLAVNLKIFDYPSDERKIHSQPIPLLGGLAIFSSFFLVLAAARLAVPVIFDSLTDRQIWSLFAGSLLLMIGGYLDDKYNLPARQQIIWPILAALVIIAGGVNLKEVTNPLGGTIKLSSSVVGGVVFFWLLGMMYTTKLLDGLDGLVTGLSAIGSLMIFFLSLSAKFYQPDIALAALIFVGALAGFLIFNFPPAKLFLGEGGSLMTGFILGVLAIVSGSKIATTLLVMGIPVADVLLVIVSRLARGRSPFVGDTGHLHHRLLGVGLSPRQIVTVLYATAALFGVLTLFLQSQGKFIALIILFSLGLLSGLWLVRPRTFFIFLIIMFGSAVLLLHNQAADSATTIKLAGQIIKGEMAKTPLARENGLSGRRSLEPKSGMLFVFETPGVYGFWMKGMKFSIDIVWVEKNRVVDIVEKAPPDNRANRPVYQPRAPASLVIELPAGFSHKYGLKVGDKVEVLTKIVK